jgi:FkbM family methyltransferase
MTRRELVAALAELIATRHGRPTFHLLEIGAAPIEGHDEPFYQVLDLFPGSQITAFEVDERLCTEMNTKARSGVRFHPVALGRANEQRRFFVTAHPTCSSLYEPNAELIRHYCHMEAAMLASVRSIQTVRLDDFARAAGLPEVDFIKIDVQGGELYVFQGGPDALRSVLTIVTEVEFIPQYLGQPLFGDVAGFLADKDFMFQCFLSFGRRSLNPFVIDDPNQGSHFVWADALFIRNILQLGSLSDEKLLKMAVLATIYGSEDLAYRCLYLVDMRQATDLNERFVKWLKIGSCEERCEPRCGD